MGQATAFDRRLEEILAPTAEAMGYEIVRIRLFGDKRRTLQIMAERADGTMTVDDCADLSRAVSAVLDVEDPISGEFTLEVSSPGIDRPLTRLKDFATWAGFEARLELGEAVDGRRRFKGRLRGVEAGDIVMQAQADGVADAEVRLPFDALVDSRLVITDDLLAKAKADQERAAGGLSDGAAVTPGEDWDLEEAAPEDAEKT